MSKARKVIFYSTIFIFLCYLVFGIFFLQYPGITADDNWEISRVRNLIQHHRIDEPLFTKDVSPFFAVYFNATPANQLIGLFKTGAFALVYLLTPLNEHNSLHFASFVWSLLLCISVYVLAIEFRLSKFTAWLSVIILVISPEFFLQVHRSRAELALALSFTVYTTLLLRTLRIARDFKRYLCLILIGLTSWIPAICLHPTGMFLPPTLAIIYFALNWKRFFSNNTFFFGISFLPGAMLYAYIYFSIGAAAEGLGGGNYFNVQGPPVLEEPFYKFIAKVPILFYKNFATLNIFSKPLSTLLFLLFVFGTWSLYKKKHSLVRFYPVILPAVITALIVTYFLSGSYVSYNIIIFPFVCIVVASVTGYFTREKNSGIFKSIIISVVLIAVFASNFYGLADYKKYNLNYSRMETKLRQSIPPGAAIIGSSLHYTTFENQPYYHCAWFGVDEGVPDQSFEEAVTALKVKYIIADDIFMAKAVVSNRGNEWLTGLNYYLNEKCTLANSFQTYYFVGGRIWDPKLFPGSWRYKGMKKNFLQKVCVYKVNP